MKTHVYANGMEIASKASSAKSIAQFPDVCFTPPTGPPAPPGLPVPYPNTAKASDCVKGSKHTKICGKPVMLKNHSYIKKSTGNEPGRAPKKGILTSVNKGKAYFAAWSMDVKIEGRNVPRHFDIMTHNHGSSPSNGGTNKNISNATKRSNEEKEKCRLRPYGERCADGKTPHHCVPDHCFREPGKEKDAFRYENAKGKKLLSKRDGLCICVTGAKKFTAADGKGKVYKRDYKNDEAGYLTALAEHGRIHYKFDKMERELGDNNRPRDTATLGQLEDKAAESIQEITGCDKDAIKDQLRDYHQSKELDENVRLRADPFGKRKAPPRAGMGKTIRQAGAPE